MKTSAYPHIQLMNPKLEVKYLRLEKTRNRLLDELEGLDDDLLNTPPAEGKWSINQIVAHLLNVERLSISYIQHKIEKQAPLPPSSFSQPLKSVLIKAVLHSGIKIKAPETVAAVPKTASLSSLRHQWDEVRFKLEDVLTDMPHHLLDHCLFRHPYAGPLTVSQTLSFFQDHFEHHLRQIHHLKQKHVK